MPTNVITFISHSEYCTYSLWRRNFAYSIFWEQVWVGVLHTVRAQKGWRSNYSAVHMHNSGRTIYLQVYFNLRKRGRHLLKPFYDENCRFMSSQKYYMIICTYHPFGEPSFIKINYLFIYPIIHAYKFTFQTLDLILKDWKNASLSLEDRYYKLSFQIIDYSVQV